MFEFQMPSLGASMEWGVLVDWNVREGEPVERGQVIAEIETEKGNIDVEIWKSGTVQKLLVAPGTKVPVGQAMALVETGEATEPAVEVRKPTPEPRPQPRRARRRATPAARKRAVELGVALEQVKPSGADGAITLADVEAAAGAAGPPPEHHVRVSPVAKRLAGELGVDLSAVEGTGEHGAIVRDDVERAAAERPGGKERVEAGEEQRLAMRRAIAGAMERSKREIPHYYLEHAVDVTDTLAWLRERNAGVPPGERVLPAVLFMRAVALAADDVPQMNGHYVDGEFRPSEAVHLGTVVAMRGGGVVAPAIHDAAQKDLDALMHDLREVVQRARRGKLRASEMTDATLTLTNLGDQGVEKVWGIIYPPQVAIVGVGKVTERPWARDGMLAARHTVTLTLAGDHRVSDGIAGAAFLSRIAQLLQRPEAL